MAYTANAQVCSGGDVRLPSRFAALRSFFLAGLALAVGAAPARGQSQLSRAEVGAQFSLLHMERFPTTEPEPGLGGRFTWNLCPSLALETEFNIFPNDYRPSSATDGGRIFSWFTGLKVAGIRRRKFAAFGKIRPGLVTFGNVAVQTSPTTVENRRVAHFATDLGGVLEVSLSPRWILRTDLGVTLIHIADRSLEVGPGSFIRAPGEIRPALQFTTGFSYRLGELRATTQPQKGAAKGRFEVAGHFAILSQQRRFLETTTEPGFGARFGYDLYPHLTLETSLLVFPRSDSSFDIQDGGRIVQWLIGVKSEIRHDKLGYFLRLRPGLQGYSRTLDSFSVSSSGDFPYSWRAHLALDLGGGIEIFTSKRTVLRFDAGDTLVFLHSRDIPGPGSTPTRVPGEALNTLQFTTGFGWRF